MIDGMIFLVAGLLVGAALVVGNREIRGKMAAWQSLATRIGLGYRPGNWGLSPVLEGTHEGRTVGVRLASRMTDKGERTFTVVSGDCRNEHGLYVSARRRPVSGEAGGRGARLGIAAATTGDPEFDSRFEVRASDAEQVKTILCEGVRRKLLWEDRANLEVNGHWVAVELRDALDDEERVRLLLDLVNHVAASVEHPEGHGAAGHGAGHAAHAAKH